MGSSELLEVQGDSGHSGGTQSQERRCLCGAEEALRTGTPAGTQLMGDRCPCWAGGGGCQVSQPAGKVRGHWESQAQMAVFLRNSDLKYEK